MSQQHPLPRKVALVVGARGVIGTSLVTHLVELGDWEVIGLSRRGGVDEDRVRHVQVDLLDREDVTATVGRLSGVTHVFYAAYQDRATWAELVEPNLAMLTNVVDVITEAAPDLAHVSLMQGYKVYGAHLGPFRTPAREDDPPHLPPEFNVDQQAYLEEKQRGSQWSWSALRPSVVCGGALGNPMNLAVSIAVLATISKAHGVPLRFPGKPGAWTSILEMTDAGLLAEATVWAATTPACANQAFNITNGDLFRWDDLWPRIADFFDMESAPPLPLSLDVAMADKQPTWDRLVREHGLAETPFAEVSSWPFADFVFSWDYDVFADGSKARRLGFHRHVRTEQMFVEIFEDLRARRIIP
jgi:nucleoside-diphosphate-sugar epimerase